MPVAAGLNCRDHVRNRTQARRKGNRTDRQRRSDERRHQVLVPSLFRERARFLNGVVENLRTGCSSGRANVRCSGSSSCLLASSSTGVFLLARRARSNEGTGKVGQAEHCFGLNFALVPYSGHMSLSACWPD